MNRLRYCFVLLILGLAIQPARPVHSASSSWQSLAAGIDYREFYLPGPNHVYVARMDRSSPQVTLDSSIAQGRLSGGLETVRLMAERYDQAINYWGEEWGSRNQVIVAINGFFYDPQTGIPASGQIQSGWYAKHFDERQSGSGIAWTLDRQIFIGGCVNHPITRQSILFKRSNQQMPFDGINIPRENNKLIIYTSQYDASTLTEDAGLEVLVEMSRPMLIMPSPAVITGTVRTIRDGQGSTPIPFDHIVLSASGRARINLLGQVAVGDEIGISQEIKHYEPDCRTSSPLSWTKTYAGIGGSYVFLRDGVIQPQAELGAVLRSPRTAIAYDNWYIYFVVVDGRDRLRSLGMSMVELAVFTRNYLGAAWGVALDGGGSSTMVVKGEVMNHPNAELDEDGVGVVSGSGQPLIERAVANGIMMVVVQPKEISGRYKPGQKVAVRRSVQAPVYLGPGSNFAVLTSLLPGSQGVILDHLSGLNGVLAKGAYWWKVAFGEWVGWVSEDVLSP
ncbi:MAG: phosphodiester glycosidase family protein [Anaerolineales bacterium]|nr:phosphodiester glycosidase family protein [Anaerolineales bacterium]